jgi:hypothetical protein
LARQFAFQLLPAAAGIALASEYAKCKNRPCDFDPGYTMTNDPSRPEAAAPSPERKVLSPAAQRALAEAEARRLAAAAEKSRPKELQGPKGPEPTRYGDWENKGIASDF